MLKIEKEKHHKELIIELEEVELRNEDIKEGESKYIIDYLYGISDIDKKINDFLLEFGLDNEWVVFYRCILRQKFLNKRYDKFRYIGKNIFLMRNNEDFEKWEKIVLAEKKIDEDLDEKIDKIIKEILESITEEKIAKTEEVEIEFKKLLKNCLMHNQDKKSEEHELAIFTLDKFLKEEYRKKQIYFNKTNFFTDILKINKSRISEIQNKYS